MSRAKIEPTELTTSYTYGLYIALETLKKLDKQLPPDCPPVLSNGRSQPHIEIKYVMALIAPQDWQDPDGNILPLKKWPKGDQAAVQIGKDQSALAAAKKRRSDADFFIDVINKTWTVEKDRAAWERKSARAKAAGKPKAAKSGATGTAKAKPGTKLPKPQGKNRDK